MTGACRQQPATRLNAKILMSSLVILMYIMVFDTALGRQ